MIQKKCYLIISWKCWTNCLMYPIYFEHLWTYARDYLIILCWENEFLYPEDIKKWLTSLCKNFIDLDVWENFTQLT